MVAQILVVDLMVVKSLFAARPKYFPEFPLLTYVTLWGRDGKALCIDIMQCHCEEACRVLLAFMRFDSKSKLHVINRLKRINETLRSMITSRQERTRKLFLWLHMPYAAIPFPSLFEEIVPSYLQQIYFRTSSRMRKSIIWFEAFVVSMV